MPDLSSIAIELKPESIPQAQKTQFVRLYIDILFMAPFLLYIAMKKKPLTLTERSILASIGIGVLYYNGRRYLLNKEILEKQVKG